MKHDKSSICIICLAVAALLLITVVVTGAHQNTTYAFAEKTTEGSDTQDAGYIGEDPREDELISSAVLEAAYTDEAEIVVGYDWEFVTRVIMAEAGAESEAEIMAVCQAVANTCRRTLQNPAEVVSTGYAEPVPGDLVNDEVRRCCERVFILGETVPEIGNAEIFYSVRGDFWSDWHESQRYIITVGEIRFFEYEE